MLFVGFEFVAFGTHDVNFTVTARALFLVLLFLRVLIALVCSLV